MEKFTQLGSLLLGLTPPNQGSGTPEFFPQPPGTGLGSGVTNLLALTGFGTEERNGWPQPIDTGTNLSQLAALTAFRESTGLLFNRSNGPAVRFSEPSGLGRTWLPMQPGLYAIVVPDLTWHPRCYRPVYFGESEALNERVTASHEKYESWRSACGGQGLYVAHCAMPTSTKDQRTAIESGLIAQYSPACNISGNIFADATRRMFGI